MFRHSTCYLLRMMLMVHVDVNTSFYSNERELKYLDMD